MTASSYVDAWNATAYGPNGMGGSYALADVVGFADLQPSDGLFIQGFCSALVRPRGGPGVAERTRIRSVWTRLVDW